MYGAWGEKKMYGKTTLPRMGIIRSTFMIDEEGRIIKVFPNLYFRVKVKDHSQEVLAVLKG